MVVEVITNYTQTKDVGSVGLYVASNGQQKFGEIHYIVNKDGKTGDFSLPATLTLSSPKKGTVDVRIIAAAYDLKGNALVVREATTTSSVGRVSQIIIPLLQENAMATPMMPFVGGTLNPLDIRDCDFHQTRDGGKCVSTAVDEASLPVDMTHTTDVFKSAYIQL